MAEPGRVQRVELIAADLHLIQRAMDALDTLANIAGAHTVELRVGNECGDTFVVGFGEQGEPALLAVIPPESAPKEAR